MAMLWPAKRPTIEHKPKITNSMLFTNHERLENMPCRAYGVFFVVGVILCVAVFRAVMELPNDVFLINRIEFDRNINITSPEILNFAHDNPRLERKGEKGEKPNHSSKECCTTSHENHIKDVIPITHFVASLRCLFR